MSRNRKNKKPAPAPEIRSISSSDQLPREFRTRAPDRLDSVLEARRDGNFYVNPVRITWEAQRPNNSFTRYGEVNRFKGASLYEVMGKKEPPRLERLQVLMSMPISFDILWNGYQSVLEGFKGKSANRELFLYARISNRLVHYIGMHNPWFSKMLGTFQDQMTEGYMQMFMDDLAKMGISLTEDED